jgi:hypothetical protein
VCAIYALYCYLTLLNRPNRWVFLFIAIGQGVLVIAGECLLPALRRESRPEGDAPTESVQGTF